MWVFSSSLSLAKPKSEILGLRSLSSNTLVALMSLYEQLSELIPHVRKSDLLLCQYIFSALQTSPILTDHLQGLGLMFKTQSMKFIVSVCSHSSAINIKCMARYKTLTYQTKYVQGYCFPCTHISTINVFLQYSTHTI